MATAKREFVREAYSGYERLKTFSIISNDLGLDFFLLTRGEESYARSLVAIPTETIDSYRGVLMLRKQRFWLKVR